MFKLNAQNLQAVLFLLFFDNRPERKFKRQFTQLPLDLYFPSTDHAEIDLVFAVFTGFKSLAGEFIRLIHQPEKNMGIDQKLHVALLPSQKSSGKGASKSSLIQI